MQHVNVFVFGTLRVHSGHWASEAEIAAPIENVTSKGTMYDYGGAYPYVDFDGDGTIYGDILTFDPEHPMYHQMRRVEIGAGYVEREVIVNTRYGPITALAWDMTPERKRYIPQHYSVVPSGDWLVAERRMRVGY